MDYAPMISLSSTAHQQGKPDVYDQTPTYSTRKSYYVYVIDSLLYEPVAKGKLSAIGLAAGAMSRCQAYSTVPSGRSSRILRFGTR